MAILTRSRKRGRAAISPPASSASVKSARTVDKRSVAAYHLTNMLNETPRRTKSDPLSATFAALADPTRRAILAALAAGEQTVGALALPFPISGPAISRHLRVLAEAGLIERKASARWRICSLRPDAMRDAHQWLGAYQRYWEESLDRLAELVEEPERKAAAQPKKAKDSKSERRRGK